MNQFPLSVVIIAKNEADNITRCIESVRWADEVVVIDDHSTDDTAARATRLGARVLTHQFTSFAGQRNWGLESGELKHEWVLMLDADESGTEALGQVLSRLLPVASSEVAAYKMCRKTMFMGRWLKRSDGFPVWIMRLVRRGRARFEDAGHGEVPVPVVDGIMDTVREPFLHFPFSRGLTDWVHRHVRYAEREAKLELEMLQEFSFSSLFAVDAAVRRRGLRGLSRKLPARPALRFLYQYLWKGGFLEGEAGFVFSLLMANYESLILAKKTELAVLARGEAI